MERHLQNYIHLYLGCSVIGIYNEVKTHGILTGVTNGGTECVIQFCEEDGVNVFEEPEWNDIKDVQLNIRRLNNMTIAECREIFDIGLAESYCEEIITQINSSLWQLHKRISELGDFNNIPQLLQMNFDIFNLIESGLANDKSSQW